jgi:hypothetical protein
MDAAVIGGVDAICRTEAQEKRTRVVATMIVRLGFIALLLFYT